MTPDEYYRAGVDKVAQGLCEAIDAEMIRYLLQVCVPVNAAELRPYPGAQTKLILGP